MYIPNRIFATCYRLIIAAISGLAVFFIFHDYGNTAYRLFPTWVALIAAIYFFCSGVATYFSVQRQFSRAISPTLQGALIVVGFSLLTLYFVCLSHDVDLPGSGGLIGTLVDFILPLLFLFDWLLFSEKGFWRSIDPWYWLALPVALVAASLVGIQLSSATNAGRFVYPFLDYQTIGLDTMLWYFGIAAVLILIFGYLCLVLDFTISGRLGEHIVLPKIKTIVIEEAVDEQPLDEKTISVEDAVTEEPTPEPASKPSVQSSTAAKPKSKNKAQPSSRPKTSSKRSGQKSPSASKKSPKTPSKASPAPQKTTSTEVKIGDLKDNKSAKRLHDTKS